DCRQHGHVEHFASSTDSAGEPPEITPSPGPREKVEVGDAVPQSTSCGQNGGSSRTLLGGVRLTVCSTLWTTASSPCCARTAAPRWRGGCGGGGSPPPRSPRDSPASSTRA